MAIYPNDGHYDLELVGSGAGWLGTFAGLVREAARDILSDGEPDLQHENEKLRDQLANQDASATELASTVEYLSEVINLAEEDSRRAELVGREPDEGLRLVIARETDKLIGLFYGTDVSA